MTGEKPTTPPLLEARHIVKTFTRDGHATHAVNDVSFTLTHGECLAVIGESGSGKTTLTRIAFGLETPDSGEILYRGASLSVTTVRTQLRAESGIIFQNPYESLDPRWQIIRSVEEPLTTRQPRPDTDTMQSRARKALHDAGLNPDQFAGRFPQDLSGGQAQRAAIARALVANPAILLADEPMSAIDVTSRLQVLDTLEAIRARGVAMIIVLHDVGVARRLADQVVVMHHGVVEEQGAAVEVLDRPRAAYTRMLLDAATL